MEAFKTILWLINIFSAFGVIFLVLMQQGKGADAGAAFGSGSAQGVFGASGSANFLSRSTAVAAIVFFATCLMLAYVSAHAPSGIDFNEGGVPVQTVPLDTIPAPQAPNPVIPE